MTKKKDPVQTDSLALPIEQIAIDALMPHPQNYRTHPQDQLDHLAASIRKHGFYRNIVIAADNTILAGHGITLAAKQMGFAIVPVVRLPIAADSIQALEVLAGDNENEHLADQDDRKLSEILMQIKNSSPDGLLGTGYDEQMLANLIYVTRPESEVNAMNEMDHWVGLPDYSPILPPPKLIISFESEEQRQQFLNWLDEREQTVIMGKNRETWSMWWPPRDKEDLKTLKWEG